MRKILAVLAMLAIAAGVSAKAQKSAPSATNFSIYSVSGNYITFTATVTGIDDSHGGATVGSWVDLSCSDANGAEVFSEVQSAALSTGWPGESRASFTLPSFTGTCDAYLFWDGWNNPRRRNTNTLGQLHFAWPVQ